MVLETNVWGDWIMAKNITMGLVLVAVGVFLIVQKTIGLDIEVWSFVWPLFLLIPGISMHVNYFSNGRGSNNLVVAGILTIYGALFLFNTLTHSLYAEGLTFIYPLGIAIGFFENYAFGNKRSGDLSAGLIFLIISVIVFLKDFLPNMTNLRDYIVPGALILFGIYVLVKRRD
jgi:hypothetical protein